MALRALGPVPAGNPGVSTFQKPLEPGEPPGPERLLKPHVAFLGLFGYGLVVCVRDLGVPLLTLRKARPSMAVVSGNEVEHQIPVRLLAALGFHRQISYRCDQRAKLMAVSAEQSGSEAPRAALGDRFLAPVSCR